MPTNYPIGLDSFNNPDHDAGDNLDTAAVKHDEQHANANDAIEALESTLGVTGAFNFLTADEGGGGGMLSILVKRKSSAQTYGGGYAPNTVLFNSTDAGGFGTGLSYETGSGRIIIADGAEGWYQAVGKVSTFVSGTQQGHIRISIDRHVSAGPPDPVAVASTYAKNEQAWLSAVSDPFYVPSHTELSLVIAHDVLDGATPVSIGDNEDSITSLAVWRIL